MCSSILSTINSGVYNRRCHYLYNGGVTYSRQLRMDSERTWTSLMSEKKNTTERLRQNIFVRTVCPPEIIFNITFLIRLFFSLSWWHRLKFRLQYTNNNVLQRWQIQFKILLSLVFGSSKVSGFDLLLVNDKAFFICVIFHKGFEIFYSTYF